MADKVRITCYNSTETKDRRSAWEFYNKGYYSTEGSERDRYASALFGPEHGYTNVNDNWDYKIEEMKGGRP